MSGAREELGYGAPEPAPPASLTEMQRRVLGRVNRNVPVGRDCASLFAFDDLCRLGLVRAARDSMPTLTAAGDRALAHARKRKP